MDTTQDNRPAQADTLWTRLRDARAVLTDELYRSMIKNPEARVPFLVR